MPNPLPGGRTTLSVIAGTGDRLSDFAPYVASLNDDGLVAFRATQADGRSSVFTSSVGSITAAMDPGGPVGSVTSHPDINGVGATCFYGKTSTGNPAVFLCRAGRVTILSPTAGPLGPAMNDAGVVAYRADLEAGRSGIFSGAGDSIRTIADVRGDFVAFHGLPVINARGAVAFRADLRDGGQCICIGDGRSGSTVAATGEQFAGLGLFPTMSDAGAVAFCAALRAGGAGVFLAQGRCITTLIDTSGPFESLRGALLNNAGRIVFMATPKGGALGVFTGPDPRADHVISRGAPLFGSTVTDFALNPVSINDAGQLAIRVALTDHRQFVLRADPAQR